MNFVVLGMSKQTIQMGKSDVRSRKSHKIQQNFSFQSSNQILFSEDQNLEEFCNAHLGHAGGLTLIHDGLDIETGCEFFH